MAWFLLETAPFKDLLNAGNVYELNEQEKVRLVYVMQNQYRKKVIQEFEEVTKVYTQVIKHYSISITPFCHFSLSLIKLQVEIILKLYIRHFTKYRCFTMFVLNDETNITEELKLLYLATNQFSLV